MKSFLVKAAGGALAAIAVLVVLNVVVGMVIGALKMALSAAAAVAVVGAFGWAAFKVRAMRSKPRDAAGRGDRQLSAAPESLKAQIQRDLDELRLRR